MSEIPTPNSRPLRLTGLIASLILLTLVTLGLGASNWTMREEVSQLREQSRELKFSIDLLRYESTSHYEGKGFNALLDHLTYWAPQLQTSNKGTVEFYKVEDRVENVVEIMGQLRDVFPQIETVLRQGGITAEDPATDDEIRKWLLRAAHAANPDKGKALYAELLRAARPGVSSRMRMIAVTALFDTDKKLTGEILHEILSNENARGIQRPGAQTARARRGQQPQFYNFINYYVASGHPDIDKTLMQILDRPEHDLLTLQACTKFLGERKVRPASKRMKALYWDQHSAHAGKVPNPLFRMKLLNAIAEIEGADAAEFLKDVDRKEGDKGIRNRLNELRKQISF